MKANNALPTVLSERAAACACLMLGLAVACGQATSPPQPTASTSMVGSGQAASPPATPGNSVTKDENPSATSDAGARNAGGAPVAGAKATATQASAAMSATAGVGGQAESAAGVAGATAAANSGGTSAAGSSAAAGGAGDQTPSAAGGGGTSGIAAAGHAGSQPGPAAGGGAGQAGAVSTGTTREDYGKPGPYQVTIEKNVGAMFRNTNVYDDTLQCEAFIAGASSSDPNADPKVIEELTSYPADMERSLYTLFRPEPMKEGKKYPVLTWGNGTCSHPLLFEELLKHLTSHGFIIIATNWRWVSSGREMLRGIDFILSENQNQNSPLFGKIDTKNIGATGHSQGSGATVVVGADSRIVATVPIQGASASDVARLKGPTFLIAGERDMLVDPQSVEQAFQAATVPAVYGLALGQDHLMPGLDPTPILEPITSWFKIHLEADSQARDYFYGDPCGICSDSAWKVQRKNL